MRISDWSSDVFSSDLPSQCDTLAGRSEISPAMSHARDLPRQSSERRLGAAAKQDESMCEIERLVWHEVEPHGAPALLGVHHYVTTCTNLQDVMIHLVFLRV